MEDKLDKILHDAKKQIDDKKSKRQETNLKILEILEDYFLMYPDMRFGQALANLNIVEYDLNSQTHEVIDPFYDESVDIFYKIPEIYRTTVE